MNNAADKLARDWAYQPELPIGVSPLWQRPLNPLAVFRWYWEGWFFITVKLVILGLTLASWFWFSPSLETAKALAPGWIITIFLRNLFLLLVIAGGLHLWFYTFRRQADVQKFDPRDLAASGKRFTLNSQVRDTMCWS